MQYLVIFQSKPTKCINMWEISWSAREVSRTFCTKPSVESSWSRNRSWSPRLGDVVEFCCRLSSWVFRRRFQQQSWIHLKNNMSFSMFLSLEPYSGIQGVLLEHLLNGWCSSMIICDTYKGFAWKITKTSCQLSAGFLKQLIRKIFPNMGGWV